MDAIVAILLAAASTEAFINELPEMILVSAVHASYPKHVRGFAEVLAEIEDGRGSLPLKYLMSAQALTGKPFDKGSNPYQDFATLVALRNDIVHLKPRDRVIHRADEGLVSIEAPRYIEALTQRGLTWNPGPKVMVSWFNRLQSPRMAAWAVDTSRNIVRAVLEMIPSDMKPIDPASPYRKLFGGE